MARWSAAALAAAGLGVLAVATAATAGADPEPAPPVVPVDGAPAPPPSQDLLSAAVGAAGQNPVAAMADLLGSTTNPVQVFGATAAPDSPGGDQLVPPTALMPQYYRMPTPDMNSPYTLTQDAPAGPFARIDAFKGVHALLHGSLGRMPAADLGQPLPGTAAPPGFVLPPGPEQFLPDPAPAAPAPPPPPPPG